MGSSQNFNYLDNSSVPFEEGQCARNKLWSSFSLSRVPISIELYPV